MGSVAQADRPLGTVFLSIDFVAVHRRFEPHPLLSMLERPPGTSVLATQKQVHPLPKKGVRVLRHEPDQWSPPSRGASAFERYSRRKISTAPLVFPAARRRPSVANARERGRHGRFHDLSSKTERASHRLTSTFFPEQCQQASVGRIRHEPCPMRELDAQSLGATMAVPENQPELVCGDHQRFSVGEIASASHGEGASAASN